MTTLKTPSPEVRTLKLYLARHGEAAPGGDDPARKLTEAGYSETNAVYEAAQLKLQDEPVDLMISSPYRRALQTAEIAIEYFVPARILVSDNLTPDTAVETVVAYLESLAQQQSFSSVMLVAHQPLLGKLLAWLTDDSDKARTVSTSSLSCLSAIVLARGCGTLEWQLAP